MLHAGRKQCLLRPTPCQGRISAVANRAIVAMALGTALQHMQDDGCVYLDYNATTPIFPEVKDTAYSRIDTTLVYSTDQPRQVLQVSQAMEPYMKHHFGYEIADRELCYKGCGPQAVRCLGLQEPLKHTLMAEE